MCWLPLLNVLAKILCRDLDALCLARDKYRATRKQYWPAEDGPIPINTPYDHVITRLEDALNATYHNIEAIYTEVCHAVRSH